MILTVGNPTTVQGFVEPAFAQRLYEVCRNVCVNGTTVGEEFANGTDFITFFSTDRDPNYRPDLTHPRVVFTVGPNPRNGGMLNSTIDDPVTNPNPTDCIPHFRPTTGTTGVPQTTTGTPATTGGSGGGTTTTTTSGTTTATATGRTTTTESTPLGSFAENVIPSVSMFLLICFAFM
jgi:hypothetical protein